MICEIKLSLLSYIYHLFSCIIPQAMAEAASPAYILETRKTAPCLRLLDKWAVCILNYFVAFINDHLFVFFFNEIYLINYGRSCVGNNWWRSKS
jgi:hypothetical protein